MTDTKIKSFWFCDKGGAFHRGFIPWTCQSGSDAAFGHEKCHWVEAAPDGAWIFYPVGF